MIDRRAALGLAGGALALGLVWWSPSFDGGAAPASTSPAPTRATDPISGGLEPRTLAAAVLAHAAEGGATHVAGTTLGTDAEVMVSVDDEDHTSYLVSVSPHRSIEPHCQGKAVVCRTTADGTLVTLRAGRSPNHPGLLGWAYRPDGSTVLVEVFSSGVPSVATALAILEDTEVGVHPSAETVVAGGSIEVDDLLESATLSSVDGR